MWWRRTPKVDRRLGIKLLDAHQVLEELWRDPRLPADAKENISALQSKLMDVYEQRSGASMEAL